MASHQPHPTLMGAHKRRPYKVVVGERVCNMLRGQGHPDVLFGRPLSRRGDHLAQHVRKQAAVPVVLGLYRGVNP